MDNGLSTNDDGRDIFATPQDLEPESFMFSTSNPNGTRVPCPYPASVNHILSQLAVSFRLAGSLFSSASMMTKELYAFLFRYGREEQYIFVAASLVGQMASVCQDLSQLFENWAREHQSISVSVQSISLVLGGPLNLDDPSMDSRIHVPNSRHSATNLMLMQFFNASQHVGPIFMSASSMFNDLHNFLLRYGAENESILLAASVGRRMGGSLQHISQLLRNRNSWFENICSALSSVSIRRSSSNIERLHNLALPPTANAAVTSVSHVDQSSHSTRVHEYVIVMTVSCANDISQLAAVEDPDVQILLQVPDSMSLQSVVLMSKLLESLDCPNLIRGMSFNVKLQKAKKLHDELSDLKKSSEQSESVIARIKSLETELCAEGSS